MSADRCDYCAARGRTQATDLGAVRLCGGCWVALVRGLRARRYVPEVEL